MAEQGTGGLTTPDESAIDPRRRQKLQGLRAAGNAFPNDFWRQNLAADLIEAHESTPRDSLDLQPVVVSIAGRLKHKRSAGKASFATLQDMSGTIQLYITDSYPGKAQHRAFMEWDVGDIVGVQGVLFKTRSDEVTVRVRDIRLLVKCLRALPGASAALPDDTRYRQRYVDMIMNEGSRLAFVQRSRVVSVLRNFLADHDYLEVETPIMRPPSGPASGPSFATHHHALDIELHLRTAADRYLQRLLVGGFEKIFEVSRTFRNEPASPIHHPEFTLLEFRVAYRDHHHVMRAIEMMLADVARRVFGSETFVHQGRTFGLSAPYERLTVEDAVGKALVQPTFVIGYPADAAPFARRVTADSRYAECFALYLAGVKIAVGWSLPNDPEEVAAKETNPGERDLDYLRAMETGMPPASGAAIGIDRLVMVLTDSASVQDVILFPLMPHEDEETQSLDSSNDALE